MEKYNPPFCLKKKLLASQYDFPFKKYKLVIMNLRLLFN